MSKDIYTHKHHIIPKHAGGTDDPSNLIELTTEQHAEAHKKLYEDYGRWQDKLAYQALSGLIGKEDVQAEAARRSILTRHRSKEEWKKGWETRRKNGWKPSEETKQKQSEANKGKPKAPFSEDHKRKLSEAVKLQHKEGRSTGYPNLSGTKWWNNGEVNKRSKECPGEGFKLGRTNRSLRN